jgi:hypothetical protein
VLLDQEGSTFTVIEATEVNSCMADHCITSNPELPVTGSSCGIPQFFERKIDACSYDEKVSDGLFLKRLMSDGVVFSVREETRAQVFCDSQTSKVYKVSGMGTANLPPGCSLILINKSGKSIKISSLPVSRSIGFGDLNLVDLGPEEIFKKAPTSEANGTSTLSKIIENHMEQLNQKLIHTDTALNTQHSYVIILGIFLGLTLVLCTITTTLAYRYSQRFRLKVRTVKEELRTGFEQATEKFKTFENKITQRRNDEFASSFPLIRGMEKQPPEIPPQSLNVLLYKMERLEQRIAQSEGYLNLDDPDIGKKEELYQNLSEVHYVSSPKPTPRLYPPIPSQSEIKMARSTLTRTHHSNVDPSAPKSQSPILPPKEFR